MKKALLILIGFTLGMLVDSFEINREVLPLKIINNDLYGRELFGPSGNQLLHFDKSNGKKTAFVSRK